MGEKKECFIGIDMGSSGVRAYVIDEKRRKISEKSFSYSSLNPKKLHDLEAKPSIWWNACINVLDEVFRDLTMQVKSICVDGTSGTVLICDKNGQSIGPALLYNDPVAAYQLPYLTKIAPSSSAVHSATSSLAKFLHLSKNIPNNAAHILHQADWIAGKLTENFGFSDENNALKMGYDPIERIWPDWLKKCPIEQSLLPKVLPVGSKIGFLDLKLKKKWDLSNIPQILIGTTDSTAAALACGLRDIGDAVTVLGSTLVVKIISEKPIFNSEYGIYSHRYKNKWIVGGASNTGGNVLSNFFSLEEIIELSQHMNENISSGCDFYPLRKKGERFPRNDPELLPKLDPRPTDDITFLKGIMEGMANIEKEGYQKLYELGAPKPSRIFTSGAGGMNDAWRNIRKRILEIPLVESYNAEAAFGSALIASNVKLS